MDTYNTVIEMIKKHKQSLVWLDSIEDTEKTIRQVVGESRWDKKMEEIINRLKNDGIVEYAMGFTSRADTEPFTYYTSLSVTEDFAKKYILEPEQLTLF